MLFCVNYYFISNRQLMFLKRSLICNSFQLGHNAKKKKHFGIFISFSISLMSRCFGRFVPCSFYFSVVCVYEKKELVASYTYKKNETRYKAFSRFFVILFMCGLLSIELHWIKNVIIREIRGLGMAFLKWKFCLF